MACAVTSAGSFTHGPAGVGAGQHLSCFFGWLEAEIGTLRSRALKERLNSFSERFMALFNTNKVKQGAVNGVYLPFWVFDAVLEVTRVKTVDMVETERSTYSEMANEISVCEFLEHEEEFPRLQLRTTCAPL